MHTVYLGTSEFAATVLERLAGGPHRPTLVLTRPDRPRGRGRKLTPPPVAEAAHKLGIPVEQPERVNDADARGAIEHAAAGPHEGRADQCVLIVCAFGALIKEPLLSMHPILNVHPSLLPRWRGAAPIERAIMAGDSETGVSIMRLTAGLDSGPVCLAAADAIGPRETFGTLAPRLAALGGELLVSALDAWERGEPPTFIEQDDRLATYAEKIVPEDRLLDPQRGALELERRVRALHPHIGARVALGDGVMLGVCRAEALTTGATSALPACASAAREPSEAAAPSTAAPPTLAPPTAAPPTLAPGKLAAVEGRLLYGTQAGVLALLEVQPPGKRPMAAEAYLRGHDLRRA